MKFRMKKCKECGQEVSELAETCIHCGCPIEKKIYCGECGKHGGELCTGCLYSDGCFGCGNGYFDRPIYGIIRGNHFATIQIPQSLDRHLAVEINFGRHGHAKTTFS